MIRMFPVLLAGLALTSAITFAADSEPTAYPTVEADWPGQGPVRIFGWMPQMRQKFWQKREQDRGAIALIGDSWIAGWTSLQDDLPGLRIANRGIGGDVTRGVLFRVKEDVCDLDPKATVLLAGNNDLTANADVATIKSNYNQIVQLLINNTSGRIVLVTIPQTFSKIAPVSEEKRMAVNVGIKAIASTNAARIAVFDLDNILSSKEGRPPIGYFAEDNLHLNQVTYHMLSLKIDEILK